MSVFVSVGPVIYLWPHNKSVHKTFPDRLSRRLRGVKGWLAIFLCACLTVAVSLLMFFLHTPPYFIAVSFAQTVVNSLVATPRPPTPLSAENQICPMDLTYPRVLQSPIHCFLLFSSWYRSEMPCES